MRITLVHPAGFNFVPGQPDFSVLANRMPPIGIMQLASWLEKFGHSVQLHDCLGPYAPPGIAANAEIILATAPEMVGFSATTSGFMDAVDMALYIKERRPEIKIAFGNVHVSSLGAPILEKFAEIDYLVMGEGEGAMLDLADGKPLAGIGNLIYRDDQGRIRINPRRDRILDLDELPFPAYEKLAGFPHAYHLPLFAYEKRHGATMITSRGCPYVCSFCDRTVFERLYKTNSAQYTYDHMKYLRDKFGVYHINMYDDLFTAKKQRVMDLCDLLIEKPLGVQFNCAIRTGHTSDEMLHKLKQAGALMVSMGIESADPGMMERHKAGVTLEAVRDTVRQIHAAGLRLVASVSGKLLGMQLAGRLLGWAKGEAGVIGWLLQTKALIMIIFANILLDKQVITSETFTALLLMAVASTMLTVPQVAPRLGRLGGLLGKAG